jgi:hypothetical protein
LNGRDSLLARRPPVDKRDIHLARPGYRAAVTKIMDRCTRDRACNDPLSLSRTTGLPGLPWPWSPRHFKFCQSRGRLGAVVNLTAFAYKLLNFREKRNPSRTPCALRVRAACQPAHGPHGHRAALESRHRVPGGLVLRRARHSSANPCGGEEATPDTQLLWGGGSLRRSIAPAFRR